MSFKSSRVGSSTFVILGVGMAIGAFTMMSIQRGEIVPRAIAQDVSVHARPASNVNPDVMTTLREMDNAISSIAEVASGAVVNIRATNRSGRDQQGRVTGRMGGGEGSGVIFRPDGWIITNEHVVNGFDTVTVTLNDGREFEGKVTAARDMDLAVIKIDAKDLPTAPFADSDQVRPGQYAIAVGSPFGLENTVTVGHVSALARESQIPDPRFGGVRFYPDLIQTDASINMGNSGGPLMNIDGQIIGINTAIFSATGGSVGIGFAIPSNTAKLIAELLIRDGKISRGYLGLRPVNLKPFQRTELGVSSGALVGPNLTGEGVPESPAFSAGIRENDVIVRLGTFPIQDQQDVRNAMLQIRPGQTVEVEVVRNKERRTFRVRVAEPPQPVAQQVPARPERNSPFPFRMPDLDDFMRGDEPGIPSPEPRDETPLRSGQARMGVQVENLSSANRQQFSIPGEVSGAVVTMVEPGSLAQRLGIRTGDVIQRIGDRDITNSQELVQAMQGVRWGDTRRIKYSRFSNGSRMVVDRDVQFR